MSVPFSRVGVPALVLSFLAGLSLAFGCSGDPTGPGGSKKVITELPRALTAAEDILITRSNNFGIQLLKEVDARREEDGSNTIISPLSASMSLGMALQGAEGTTFEAMRDALGFDGLAREEIGPSYESLLDLLLNLDPEVEVQLANSAWSQTGFPFAPAYFEALKTHFDAVAQEVDFHDPATTAIINQWVSDHTNGRIPKIVEELDSDLVLYLVNALFFKGDWTTQFKKGQTQTGDFQLENGSSVDVPMMSGSIPAVGFRWLFHEGRKIGELPYGGQAFGLVIVVPGPDETVTELVSELDDATWASWVESLPRESVSVSMPSFELEWGSSLIPSLEAMGMGVAFTPFQADFSRMCPTVGLYLSEVSQKTYLRVDEEGTEAAAVTSTGVKPDSAPPELRVDRPFLLAIRERLSGTVLFFGIIRDPR